MEQKTKNNIEMDEDGFITTQPRKKVGCNIRSCKICNDCFIPKKHYNSQGKGTPNYNNGNNYPHSSHNYNNNNGNYRPAKKYCFNNCDFCQKIIQYLDQKVEEFHDDGYFTVFFK